MCHQMISLLCEITECTYANLDGVASTHLGLQLLGYKLSHMLLQKQYKVKLSTDKMMQSSDTV